MPKIAEAIKILKAGGVIAFPTETVFGIGASLKHPAAIRKIYKIKKRPGSKPLQVLVASLAQAKKLGKFSKEAEAFAKKHWPGPLTLIVYKTGAVPKSVCGGGLTVGLRMPNHKTILSLIKKVGPIAATSANTAGQKPALNDKEVLKNLPKLDYVLPGKARIGKASRVIDATKNFKLLRK